MVAAAPCNATACPAPLPVAVQQAVGDAAGGGRSCMGLVGGRRGGGIQGAAAAGASTCAPTPRQRNLQRQRRRVHCGLWWGLLLRMLPAPCMQWHSVCVLHARVAPRCGAQLPAYPPSRHRLPAPAAGRQHAARGGVELSGPSPAAAGQAGARHARGRWASALVLHFSSTLPAVAACPAQCLPRRDRVPG